MKLSKNSCKTGISATGSIHGINNILYNNQDNHSMTLKYDRKNALHMKI